jgi:hypothetical protein
LLTGRLVAHGAAPYQFRSNEAASYFVKLQSSSGEKILWGKDLARAISESQTQVALGDMVGLQRVAREAITSLQQERNAQGEVVRQRERIAHRNRWVIEKASFFAQRARLARVLRDEQLDRRAAVREHPELVSTFLTLRAAQEFASRRHLSEADTKRFVSLVRDAIEGSIVKGEPLPSVRLREPRTQAPKSKTPPSRTP